MDELSEAEFHGKPSPLDPCRGNLTPVSVGNAECQGFGAVKMWLVARRWLASVHFPRSPVHQNHHGLQKNMEKTRFPFSGKSYSFFCFFKMLTAESDHICLHLLIILLSSSISANASSDNLSA